MKSAPAIAFDYRPSRGLIAGVGAMLLLAIAAVLASGFAILWQTVLIGAAGVYAVHSLRVLLRRDVTRCAWHATGQWRIRDDHGEEQVATLLHFAVRGPLVALVLRAGPLGRVSLVLLPDNCDADTRRQLRVRLARANALDG